MGKKRKRQTTYSVRHSDSTAKRTVHRLHLYKYSKPNATELTGFETTFFWSLTGESKVESGWNVMAHGDAREGKWRGKMEWVANTLHTTPEHGVPSITTADAHTSAASSRLNWRPRRFKWTRPFRRKTKSGFCACAITFQTHPTAYFLPRNLTSPTSREPLLPCQKEYLPRTIRSLITPLTAQVLVFPISWYMWYVTSTWKI